MAAKNAAGTVGPTVAALRSLDVVSEVLVVDDGSTDHTRVEALAAGATVLRLPENVGKGGAVAAGVEASPHADVFLLVDADVGTSAVAAAALLTPVLAGQADMVTGVLPSAGGRGGFGLVRDLAGEGIRRATRGSTPGPEGGFRAQAPLSGQRAVRASLLRTVDLAPRFGLEVGLTVDAVRRGARVIELPVEMDHRHTGRGARGFAHRARQGLDVVRALWPRLTSPSTRVITIVIGAVLVLGAVLWSGSRWEPSSSALGARPAKVVLFGMPGLAWDDLGGGAVPNLDRMASEGAVGALSVRTLWQPDGSHRRRESSARVSEGYAAMGAGSRIGADAAAGQASNVGGRVVVADADAVRGEAGEHTPTRPGALGDALHEGGRRTAVVGNADTAAGLFPGGAPAELRPTAVALMDRTGVVDAGTVSPDLVVPAERAPFGRRADPDAVLAATGEALARADVVLVDPGDLSRVEALAEADPPPGFASRLRDRALADTDALLGRLRATLPPDVLLMVVSVIPRGEELRLTPVVATGPGVPRGELFSPSTKRAGLVALSDVAPTVLDAVGAQIPADMVGRPVRYRPGTPDVAGLVELDRDASYRQRIYYPLSLGFIVFQGLVYLFTAWALTRPRGSGRAQTALRLAALAIAAWPLATFLFRAVPDIAEMGTAGVLALVGIDAAIVAVAARARRHPLAPLGLILGATVGLLVLDVATGARLQVASLMGYSPEVVARFYGIGNTTFAILAATTLLSVAVHLHAAPRRREALVTAAGVLSVVALLDGLPFLGDDVGGILTLVPVFAVSLWAFCGRRVTWRVVGGALGLGILLLGAATAIDLLRPPESRTHLARVVANTWEHGDSNLTTTIARKADANFRVLRTSIWAWSVPMIAVFLLWLLVRRRRWATLLPPASPLRTGVVAALAAGLCGFLANDSGVVVTALALTYVGAFLSFLALSRARSEPVLQGPGPQPRPPQPVSSPS